MGLKVRAICLVPDCLDFISSILIHNCSITWLGMNGKLCTEQEMDELTSGTEV